MSLSGSCLLQDVENVLLVDGGPNLERLVRFDVELLELDAVELELVVRNLLLRCLRCRFAFLLHWDTWHGNTLSKNLMSQITEENDGGLSTQILTQSACSLTVAGSNQSSAQSSFCICRTCVSSSCAVQISDGTWHLLC